MAAIGLEAVADLDFPVGGVAGNLVVVVVVVVVVEGGTGGLAVWEGLTECGVRHWNAGECCVLLVVIAAGSQRSAHLALACSELAPAAAAVAAARKGSLGGLLEEVPPLSMLLQVSAMMTLKEEERGRPLAAVDRGVSEAEAVELSDRAQLAFDRFREVDLGFLCFAAAAAVAAVGEEGVGSGLEMGSRVYHQAVLQEGGVV